MASNGNNNNNQPELDIDDVVDYEASDGEEPTENNKPEA